MFKVLVFLPLLLIALAWIFGIVNITRFVAIMAGFMVMCGVSLEFAVLRSTVLMPFAMIVAGTLLSAIPGALIALLFSLKPKQTPAPIDHVIAAHESLDDEAKARLHGLLRKGARVAAKHFANHLEKKGHSCTADAVREMTQ